MIERELKIPVAALDGVRRRLTTTSAEPVHPRLREINILLDTADADLAGEGKVLRVRQMGEHTVLTFKGPATYVGALKERQEIELHVASKPAMIELLGALGYHPTIRYEKERESWRIGPVRIDLDRTPMGEFVELEGLSASLEEIAGLLGLDPSNAVPGSYVSLWQEYRKQHPELGLGPDMVFDP